MGLTLSQVPQLSSLQDHSNITQSPHDVLRLGGGRTGQFTHLLPPSIGSSFRPPPQQAMPSSNAAFFGLSDQTNQNSFHEDHHQSQSQQGLFGNKPFHGLMQFPSDIQTHANNNSNSASNLFNLSFISNPTGDNTSNMNNNNDTNTNNSNSSSNNNNNLPSSLLNQFNGTNNGNNDGPASNIFAVNIMGDQINSAAVPSLYSNTAPGGCSSGTSGGGAIPHMSATALLQKAAQLGSTTSSSNTTATLLRTFGSSSTSSGKASDRTLFPPSYGGVVFSENESNLQDLMNSFANASSGSGMFGSFGVESLEDPTKLQQNLSTVSMGGGTDRLTRDFLGVGQIVRSMSGGGGGGGYSQREHKQGGQGIVMEGNESNTAPSSNAFGGGNGNYQ